MTPEPRRRGWLTYSVRVVALSILLVGAARIAFREIDLHRRRVDIRQSVIEKGGSYVVRPDGGERIELSAERFSRDEIRQIHQAFPTAEIALSGH
jgi:hypothetical protein